MNKQRVCKSDGWHSQSNDGGKTRTILPNGFLSLDVIMVIFAVIVIVVVLVVTGTKIPLVM